MNLMMQMICDKQLGKVHMCNTVKKNLMKMLKNVMTYSKMLSNLCMKVAWISESCQLLSTYTTWNILMDVAAGNYRQLEVEKSSRELWSKHKSLFFFILLYLHSGTFFLLFGKTNVNCVNSRHYVLPISTYFKFYVFSPVLFFSSFPAAHGKDCYDQEQ